MNFGEEEPKVEAAEDVRPSATDRAAETLKKWRPRKLAPPGAKKFDPDHLKGVLARVLDETPLSKATPYTIYPVPPEILRSDEGVEKFYKPKVVSIGPILYEMDDKHLRPMQDYKWTCVYKLINKMHHSPEESHPTLELLQRCLDSMMERDQSIRDCYYEEIKFDRESLAVRMMVDGCFILYLLLMEGGKMEIEVDDVQQVIGRVWIWDLVKYDLLLLENQIPFFVVKKLHDILVTDDSAIDLVACALKYFSSLDPCRKQGQPRFYIPHGKVHHLLHLVYLSVLPCPQYYKPTLGPGSPQWIPSATELKDAGVKFKKREIENKRCFLSFLDIEFKDGVMEIPQVRAHDYSVSLFRNFIAFEQCYPGTGSRVTAYAALMNCLIDKEEDMRSLHLDQILISGITTEKDARHFFRRLCNEVRCAPEKNYLGNLITEVRRYHGTELHQLHGYVKREYFKNPLTTLVVIVGMLAFLFSLTQGIISMYFNFHPRK